jgi:hypothetical protein
MCPELIVPNNSYRFLLLFNVTLHHENEVIENKMLIQLEHREKICSRIQEGSLIPYELLLGRWCVILRLFWMYLILSESILLEIMNAILCSIYKHESFHVYHNSSTCTEISSYLTRISDAMRIPSPWSRSEFSLPSHACSTGCHTAPLPLPIG